MDEPTRTALEESIEHWEENLAHAEAGEVMKVSTASMDCALCQRFMGSACQGCPVSERTARLCCRNTPYHLVDKAVLENDLPGLISACQAELNFLKSLREEGGQWVLGAQDFARSGNS